MKRARYLLRSSLSGKMHVGFVLSLASGMLILINAGAFLSSPIPSMMATVPLIFAGLNPMFLFAVDLVLGTVALLGAASMFSRFGTYGAGLVMPAAISSAVVGGGFGLGMLLGILGGATYLWSARIESRTGDNRSEKLPIRVLHLPSKQTMEIEVQTLDTFASTMNRIVNIVGPSSNKTYEFGLVVAEKQKSHSTSSKNCQKCGANIRDTARFCSICGSTQ